MKNLTSQHFQPFSTQNLDGASASFLNQRMITHQNEFTPEKNQVNQDSFNSPTGANYYGSGRTYSHSGFKLEDWNTQIRQDGPRYSEPIRYIEKSNNKETPPPFTPQMNPPIPETSQPVPSIHNSRVDASRVKVQRGSIHQRLPRNKPNEYQNYRLKFSEQHRLHTNYEKQVGVNEQFSPHTTRRQADQNRPPVPTINPQENPPTNKTIQYFKEENIPQNDQLQLTTQNQKHRISDFQNQMNRFNQSKNFRSLPTAKNEQKTLQNQQNQPQPQFTQQQKLPQQVPPQQPYNTGQNQQQLPLNQQQFLQIQQSPSQKPQVQGQLEVEENSLSQSRKNSQVNIDVPQQKRLRYFATRLDQRQGSCARNSRRQTRTLFLSQRTFVPKQTRTSSWLWMAMEIMGIMYPTMQQTEQLRDSGSNCDLSIVGELPYTLLLIETVNRQSSCGERFFLCLPRSRDLFDTIRDRDFYERDHSGCSAHHRQRYVVWQFRRLTSSKQILLNQSVSTQSIYELSQDHKPENPTEYQRITTSGGRVSPIRNQYGQQVGPHRVWAKHFQYPGLAMSRSLGDSIAHQVGVLSIPDIVGHKIGPDDYFIIMGSDGLWDYLEKSFASSTVFQMYKERNEIQTIAEFLVLNWNPMSFQIAKSLSEWKKLDDAIDDITCIIIQLRD